MAWTIFLRMDSSERFRYVALRIGSSEVLAELPHHARTILLDPRAKMAEAQLISVSDLPDYAWLNDPCSTRKRSKYPSIRAWLW